MYRKLFYAVFFCFSLSVGPIYAQEITSNYYITTKPNAAFYPVSKEQFFGANHRIAFDYTEKGRPKKMADSQKAQVIGLVNLVPSLVYDTYVVLLKGKRYYIHSDQVEDNEYINHQNEALLLEYDRLIAAVSSNEANHVEAYNRILAKIDSIITDNESIISTIEEKADSLEYAYIKDLVINDISRARANKDKYYKWVKTLPSNVQPAAESFAIVGQSLENASGGAYNYSMTFINLSPKTIKDIFWNGRVKNAMGDYIACQAKGTTSFSERIVGPVAPQSREFAIWNNLIYNKEAYALELSSVQIEYTDGSTLFLDSNMLDYVSHVPSDVLDKNALIIQSAYENLRDDELKAPWVFELNRIEFREHLRSEKKERLDSNNHWKEIKQKIIQEGLWSSYIEHLGIGISNAETYKSILDELRIYGNTKRDKKSLEDNLLKFERINLIYAQ